MINNQEQTLYLLDQSELVKMQLSGKKLGNIDLSSLTNHISTDAIIPSRYCYEDADPSRLGRYCLVGLQNQAIEPDDIQNSSFHTLVAGTSFGRGSSREHAQLAFLGAGIEQLVVQSAERIFLENCNNYGLPVYPLDNSAVMNALRTQTLLPRDVYLKELPPISRIIASEGGLLPFTKARLEGRLKGLEPESIKARPMTMTEKIIASHAGVRFTRPGQQFMVDIDYGYFYELQSIVTASVLNQYFPEGFQIREPHKFRAFEDHLALQINPMAENLRLKQQQFTKQHNIPSYQVEEDQGIEGICHTVMTEKYVLPGQLVLGNDSHTCTLGVNGALAIGKGASEMAAAMILGKVPVTVPETIRIDLANQLREGVTSKDLILEIARRAEFKTGLIGSNRTLEFGGDGLSSLSHDEQLVLSNMAIELQGYTGIIEPNFSTLLRLANLHSVSIKQLLTSCVFSDDKAEYYRRFFINLDTITPMIALPGDPQNAIPLAQLDKIDIDIAYIGSCTGGKFTDLLMAARILEGKKVNSNVQLFIQASSRSILEQAKRVGLLEIFRKAGAQIILPGCGACMGAGPGSTEDNQVMISDTNRNFAGRTGKGKGTYLASPITVAKSAIKGYIN